MKMVKNQGAHHKQKMSRRTIVIAAVAASSLLIVIALLFIFNVGNIRQTFAATPNPVLNTRILTISNDGAVLKLKVQMQCTTPGHRLNSGDFYLTYDPTAVSYKNIEWAEKFNPGKSSNYNDLQVVDFGPGTGFENKALNQMDITIVSVNTNTGVTLSNTEWTDVCDLEWNIKNPAIVPQIKLNPAVDGSTYSDIYDAFSGQSPVHFDKGSGFNEVLKVAVNPPAKITLTASLNDKVTTLGWATESENNSKLFTIERSRDGIVFETLLTRPGAGNSVSKTEYTASDESPLDGISYYRLLQTDNNGTTDTLNTVAISNIHTINFAIKSINPTSFRDFTTIAYTMPEDGNPQLMITNLGGKTMINEQVSSQKGDNNFRLDNTTGWLPGMYIVSMQYKGLTVSSKMIRIN